MATPWVEHAGCMLACYMCEVCSCALINSQAFGVQDASMWCFSRLGLYQRADTL